VLRAWWRQCPPAAPNANAAQSQIEDPPHRDPRLETSRLFHGEFLARDSVDRKGSI